MIIEIDPRVDVVFHNLFGSSDHPGLTMSFVNALLEHIGLPKAVELELSNPFQLARFIRQKESELDILYRDASQRQIQLEMQIAGHSGLAQRMLHNWTQIYQRQLSKGQEYNEHIPVISFWILDDNLFHDQRWLHVFRCGDRESVQVLHEDLCIVTIELPVWQKQQAESQLGHLDLLGKWLYFLTRAKGSEAERLLGTLAEPVFAEAVELISGFTKEEKRRHAYDMRENYERIVKAYIRTGYEEGMEKGEIKGEQKGLKKGKLEVAQAMLNGGMSIAQVLQFTGLSRKDLEGSGLIAGE